MNTHKPYDTSTSYGDYPHSAVSPYYNVQHSSSARPESVDNSTPVAVASQHHIPSLNLEAPRRPDDDSQHQYLSPSIPIDSQFTRRASTSAIYGQSSTRTTPTSGPYVRPSRPTPFSTNALGHKRSASDSHFQPPRLGSRHQKSASAGKQPDLTPFGSAPPIPFHSYDEGRQEPQWSTQYTTSSSVDTSAETSSRNASYDTTPVPSASPFSATAPQSFDGPSRGHPTWSNPEQVVFNSDHVDSLPAPYSPSVPTIHSSTALFTNYAQPSVPPTSSALQSLTSATLHPDHAMHHTSTATNFPEAYTPSSEGYDGSPAGFLSTASSTLPSVPFDATATEQNTSSAELSHLHSNTTYASARLPYPTNVPSPALNPRTLDPSSYATPEPGPSSSEQHTKKSLAKKMVPHTQSSSTPGASGSSDTMASSHHDSLAVGGTAVKAKGTKRKHREDDVEILGDRQSEAGPSKKAKSSGANEKKREGDREYQQEFRQRANERREEIWRLAGITTGTLEKRQERRTFLELTFPFLVDHETKIALFSAFSS
ncbi:uncharacterized protein STEHIDRAFT_156252 [Stereum hirsutum FP-91666 SS1]|uniref:uncharacterized protein n=1 Tax=Stereum hirsutum (strain FP-91666) TaxID=721885 RepID=UPI000440EABC|nr:uncharacterized protein STEHIDRAFT_156252 [Stereum hirsutum FP-91666 SS1]EIM87267.1 hypothetical protein STEHIDRAFT_156252 [Stereum hirsutum FP-91666 SS1]